MTVDSAPSAICVDLRFSFRLKTRKLDTSRRRRGIIYVRSVYSKEEVVIAPLEGRIFVIPWIWRDGRSAKMKVQP
jgi:hypothetical protein